MTTTPAPEPLSDDPVGLAFQVLFDAGVVLEPPLTRAVMTEALRAALRANGADVTRAEIANWYLHLFYGQTSDNNFPNVFIKKFAGRRIGHE